MQLDLCLSCNEEHDRKLLRMCYLVNSARSDWRKLDYTYVWPQKSRVAEGPILYSTFQPHTVCIAI